MRVAERTLQYVSLFVTIMAGAGCHGRVDLHALASGLCNGPSEEGVVSPHVLMRDDENNRRPRWVEGEGDYHKGARGSDPQEDGATDIFRVFLLRISIQVPTAKSSYFNCIRTQRELESCNHRSSDSTTVFLYRLE